MSYNKNIKKLKVKDAKMNKKLIGDTLKIELIHIKNTKPKPPVIITDTEDGDGDRWRGGNDVVKPPKAPVWFGGAMKTALNPIETRLDNLETRLAKVETSVSALQTDVSGLKTDLSNVIKLNNLKH